MNIDIEVLRKFTARTLKSWSVYQLALDNSCGGDETKENDKWFLDMFCEQITIARGLKVGELEDYQIAFFLREGFGHIKNHNEPALQQLMSKLHSDEELVKVKHKSEDDVDMKIPKNEEEEEGPSKPQRPQRQVLVNNDGSTITNKQQRNFGGF
ncbi:hypothetical protein CRE_05116 [Caenorhabditis remanei]|uniref:Pre-rRNA-processing protein TSR2 homolog n=1 Tax=Caenorhabditis remanei TaxID=31234 RepID=E3N6A3_CAERE|nr:hypothetical protein CRE_05116 [Caenorhabditis remanei]